MGSSGNYLQITKSLADSFTTLANEVQTLADRRTILEHKLRFAHEQFQRLADKYAPAASEVAETLARLQLPPHTSLDGAQSVPLPGRHSPQTSQHQVALIIRDGKRMASQLASLGDASKTTTGSSRETFSNTSHPVQTSMSTALEQDFTVEGKKGDLLCPFQPSKSTRAMDGGRDVNCRSNAGPSDLVCAGIDEASSITTHSKEAAAGASRCPIRYLDKQSPAEVAHYVETHKHELPRSHEVCLRRYQQSEDQIRKLDSKYGDIVSMIEGLSHLHKPMLPESGADGRAAAVGSYEDVDRISDERVQNWAQDVGANTDPEAKDEASTAANVADERHSHFDRPLKEVRVGESPSRPWGISVPVFGSDKPDEACAISPPPVPVRMPETTPNQRTPGKSAGKCPFDHTKLGAMGVGSPHHRDIPPKAPATPPPMPQKRELPFPPREQPVPVASHHAQPAFINAEAVQNGGSVPKMVFTGPVFIGYPMEQAIQFMNQYQNLQPSDG